MKLQNANLDDYEVKHKEAIEKTEKDNEFFKFKTHFH